MNDLDNRLVKEYSSIAIRISKQYKKHPVVINDNAITMDDIEQMALIGLWEALNTHDSDKGPLGVWIRQHVHSEIATWLRDNGCTVKMPRTSIGRDKVCILPEEHVPDKGYKDPEMTIREARKVLIEALTHVKPPTVKIISMRWGIPNGRVYKISEISDCLRMNKTYIHRVFNKTMEELIKLPNVKEALDVIT